MKILGVNAYHGDSSACILVNGRLIAAVEEERFRRIKHWAGFPAEAIRYCLEEARISLEDVDIVAINQDSKANFLRKAGFALSKRPSLSLILGRLKVKRQRESIEELLTRLFQGKRFKGKVQCVEHHLAHLASAFYVSPFEKAIAVSIDGFGDFSSGAWGVAQGTDINIDGRVYFPHSLGIFYQALTQYLGFPNYGDEYKVMGLAPYGEPKYLDKMREIVKLKPDGSYRLNLKYFRHHKEDVGYAWENSSPLVGRLFADDLASLLGPVRQKDESLDQKHKDMARSIQAMYEESFFHILNTLHKKHKIDELALAGGCAMNSVANGKVYRRTPFKKLYVQSAAGDSGGAIGAALVAAQKAGTPKNGFTMAHAYWGPGFSNDKIREVLEKKGEELKRGGCSVEAISDEMLLCKQTAQAISEGKVIGWFQGRMEWGPRALGNRSIIGDPRRADMKDVLNLKIKRRESFRPFAPSILREAVSDWFEQEDDVPFMMKVFQIRKSQREKVPAVTHMDGSGRLQTVTELQNYRYYNLIKEFEKITDVPMVLNTSFNENEPIVCKPEEALACFLRTKMDVLVLGDWYLERER